MRQCPLHNALVEIDCLQLNMEQRYYHLGNQLLVFHYSSYERMSHVTNNAYYKGVIVTQVLFPYHQVPIIVKC